MDEGDKVNGGVLPDDGADLGPVEASPALAAQANDKQGLHVGMAGGHVKRPRVSRLSGIQETEDVGIPSTQERVTENSPEALLHCEAVTFPRLPPSGDQQPVTRVTVHHELSGLREQTLQTPTSTLVLAAWALVACQMINSKDIVFGAAVAGSAADVIPIRVKPRGDQSVSGLLEAVRIQLSNTYHDAQQARKLATLLVLQRKETGGMQDGGPGDSRQERLSTYGLVLRVHLGDTMAVSACFDTRVLDPWMARNLLRRLDWVMRQLDQAEPDEPLDDIQTATSGDLEQIWEWNTVVPAAVERSIYDIFEDKARERPSALAIDAWDGKLTYSELDQLATTLAERLVESGVGPDVFVSLCFEKSVWASVAMLGVAKAGGAFVLLDPTQPEQRLEAIVEQVGARLILTSASKQELGSRLGQESVTLDWPLFADLGAHQAGRGVRQRPPPTPPSSILYVVFTSGSTGTPKGVMITHANAASALFHQVEPLGLTADTRLFDFASYSFDVSINNLLTVLAAGGCLCVPSDEDRRDNLEKSIISLRANTLDMTPSIMRLLSPGRMPEVRSITLGGEALGASDAERFWGKVQIRNAYGPSECTPTSTANCGASSPGEATSIGKGLGVVTWVVDPDNHNRLVPPGCVGELLLEGPLVGSGYLDDPARTSAAFVEAPAWLRRGAPGFRPGRRRARLYKTGDLVRHHDDGSLAYVGRKDAQVKVRGQRVELGEVEHHLRACFPGAREVAVEVLARDGTPTLTPTLAAFLVTDGEESGGGKPGVRLMVISPEDEAELAGRLPSYMVPGVYLALDELPVNSAGKTDRPLLRALGREGLAQGLSASSGDGCAGVDAGGRALQNIWARVLNVEAASIGPNDSFFRLGGDSITAMQVSAAARASGMDISTADVLRKKTIAALLAATTRAPKHRPGSSASQDDGQDDGQLFQLSPMQQLYTRVEPDPARCYDQNFLLRLRKPLTASSLATALETMVARHAMLRARFVRTGEGRWKQRIAREQDGGRSFHLSEAPLGSDVAGNIRRCRQRLDIERGPLLAAMLLPIDDDDGTAAPGLFMAIHHLVIDLVSWRVLLQELEEMVTGGRLSSPPPPTSFRAWSSMQAEYAHEALESGALEAMTPPPMLSYWGMDAGDNVQGAAASRRFLLDSTSSAAILGAANEAFGTRPVEILIAALAHSFGVVFPDRAAPPVFNKGHGREPWDDGLDVSRTVGWFTTMYPVCAPAPAADLPDAVRRTKDCVRSLANNGWSFFTSRFADEDRAAANAGRFPVEVVLNFGGLYQQLERGDALFELVPVPDGDDCSPVSSSGLRRFELFEFSVHVTRGLLAVSLLYPARARHQESIAAWMDRYQATLVQAAQLLGGRPREWTLSDFSGSAFASYDSLDEFRTRVLPRLGIACPDDVEAVFPCTGVQEGMLVAQAKDSANYRSALDFDISASRPGDSVDLARVERAWRAVVRRHSLLRAVLVDAVSGTSGTMHAVLRDPAPAITYVPDADDAAVDGLRGHHTRVSYQKHRLQHHLSVLRVDQRRVCVRLEINHAITDGHSDGVLLRDFWQAYNGSLSPQGPLYSDFVEYVGRQQAQAASGDFWTAYLDGVQPCLFPASKAGRERVRASSVAVPGLDAAQVHAFCAGWELTTASVVQAAWALVLRQYTGSTTPCFGNLVSSRDVPIKDIGDMFGPVIAMTPRRIQLGTGLSVIETLQQVHSHHLDSLAHQAHSLLEMQGALDVGQSGLFNSILSFQKARNQLLMSADGHRLDERGIVDPVEYAISVNVEDSNAAISIQLDFNAGIVTSREAERVAQTLGAAVSLLVSDPWIKISDVNPLSENDVEQLWSWNGSVPASAEQCVHEMIEARAQGQPGAPAVCAWDGTLTYGELVRLATMLARRLVTQGVGAGVVVPLCFDKSMWTTVAMLGVIKAGGAFVLVDPSLPEQRLQAVIRQVNASLLLSSASHRSLGSRLCPHVVAVSPEYFAEPHHHASEPLPIVGLDSVDYVVFTSGTTGTPKGAIITHRNSASAVLHQVDGFGYSTKSRVYDFSTYSFDGSILNAFTVLVAGGCLCVPTDRERTNNLESSLNSLRANAVFLTPSLTQLLSPERLSHLEVMIIGGEVIRVKDVEPWWGRVFTIYGPSECTPVCMINPHPSSPEEAVRLGKGYGAVTWIVDAQDHNHLLPLGCTGELLLEGPLVGGGYLGNPEKTAAAFIEDPVWLVPGARGRPGRRGRLYKTGDLACYNEDGSISFVGRKDTQVKIRGQRVELGEVEHWVQMCMPEATQVAAEVIESQGQGSSPFLALFLQADSEAMEPGDPKILPIPPDVERILVEHLPSYLVPTVVFSMPLPMTTTGKINRKHLRQVGASFSVEQLAEMRTAGLGPKRQPTSETELCLQKIWARVLNIEASTIGLEDSFFRLGGDSIAAIKVVGEARKSGLALAVADIFRHPSLQDIANQGLHKVDNNLHEITPFSLLGDGFDARDISRHYGLDPATICDAYPCTPLQEGLISLTSKQSGNYITQSVLELSPSVAIEDLRRAWERVARVMPVLRTRLVQQSDTDLSLIQVVLDEQIRWIDATGLEQHLRSDREQSMELGKPLTRYAFVRDETGTPKWFAWTMHHALYDGWSMPLIIDAVFRAYQGELIVEGPRFQSFISYIKKQDDGQISNYWRQALEDCECVPFPAFPPSLQQQQLVTDSVIEHSLALPQDRRLGITTSILVRAAWALVVGRMTDLDEVVFGVTVSGRSAPVAGLDRMAAPTIATVPVRVRMRGDQTVADYLDTAQRQATEMIPFEQTGLQRIAKLCSAGQKACMFQTLLVVQPQDDGFGRGPLGTWLDGNKLQWSDTYALTLELRLGMDKIVASTSFDPRAIEPWMVWCLLRRLDFVLQQLDGADPGQTLAEIKIVNEQDLDRIWEWNSTVPSPAEQDVHQMIAERVRTQPDAPAVCAWDGELTYGQLDQLASILMGRLIDHEVGSRRMLVPLCFEKSMWTTVAILGVIKAGAGFVLLDRSLPEKRLQAIVQQVQGSLILSSQSNQDLSSRLAQKTLTLGWSFFTDLRDQASRHARPPCLSSILYTIFTSGSTGAPKGVEITHLNAASAVHHQTQLMGLTRESRFFDFASYSFDVSISNVLSALTTGGCLCVPQDEDRRTNLEHSIASLRANVLDITPTVAQLLSPARVPSVRTIIFSGEALRVTDVERWWQAGVQVCHAYGPSECTPTSTLNCGARSPQEVISIGKGAGLVTWVVSPENHGELLPPGCVGELLLEGPLVGRGYLASVDKTAAVFVEDPPWLLQGAPGRPGRRGRLYKTGDLVRYNEDGTLTFIGRKDSQIKIRGQRVELEEVEYQVHESIPEARQVVAEVITPEDEGSSTLVVFLKMGDDRQADQPEPMELRVFSISPHVEKRLAKHLPIYMIPALYLSIGELPSTPTGKTDRKRLREVGKTFFTAGAERWLGPRRRETSTAASGGAITEAEQPAYVLAQKVFSMLPSWHRGLSSTEDVAPCQGIAFDDVLLQPSGLDSINMMSLVHYVSREFGVKLSLELLMDRTTSIRTLAKSVSSLRASPGKQSPGMLPAQLSPSVDIMAEINRHDSGIAAAQRELASAEAGHDPNPASDESLTVFLTGANGFIGSQILRQLLENRQVGRVVALVRGETQDAARSRTINAASKALWWTNFHSVKLQVWPGDLSLPRLGLDPTHWGLVTDGTSFDVIIHNGAEVHWGKSYATLEATNVNSTVELLRVAVAAPRMRFVYVSGGRERVAQDEQESDVARELGAIDAIGYSQTKFVAEAVVRRAAVRCMSRPKRLATVTPGLVVGTPAEGVSNADDYLWRLAASCIRVGAYNADEADAWLDLSDVAAIAKNIIDTALDPDTAPEAMAHVRDGMKWGELWAILRGLGHRLEAKGAAPWLAAIRADIELLGETHPLWPLTHLLEAESLVAKEEADSCREVGNTPRTLRVAVRRSAEFLEKCGFLPRPLVKPEAALQAMLQEPFSRSGHELRSRFGLPGTPSERIPT